MFWLMTYLLADDQNSSPTTGCTFHGLVLIKTKGSMFCLDSLGQVDYLGGGGRVRGGG